MGAGGVRVGGRCTGSAQSVAAHDKPRDVIHPGHRVFAKPYDLDPLTPVFHHTQLLLVAEKVEHLNTAHQLFIIVSLSSASFLNTINTITFISGKAHMRIMR